LLLLFAVASSPPFSPRRTTRAGPDFLLLASVAPGSLVDPRLRVLGVDAAPGEPGRFLVRWAGDAPALFVWFETPLRGAFSDNGFAFVPGVAPGPEASLMWTAAPDAGAPPSAAELVARLFVWSLFDVTAGVDLTKKRQ